MRAVIFELTSTESTGMIVPVADTVDFISMRTTVAVSPADSRMAFSACCTS